MAADGRVGLHRFVGWLGWETGSTLDVHVQLDEHRVVLAAGEMLGGHGLVRTGSVAGDERGRVRLSRGLRRLLSVTAGGQVAAVADRRTGLLVLESVGASW